jgi:phospholipid transport system transporter-binding protein
VDDVDSAAVSLLLEWVRQAAQLGHKLRINNLPDNLQCLVKVYGVKELLPAA